MHNQLFNKFKTIYSWAKNDFNSWPLRFSLEITAWALSILCSVWMALTVPHPPFLILYPLFITQCAIFAWSAWTRKSTGLVANYMLLVTIDSVALTRLMFFT
jgi:hypothetical protein